jgi:WD40 repeat protein
MSDLTLPDGLAERIRVLAQSEKISVEELLTIMVDRYTIASRVKVAENQLKLSGTEAEETTDDSPPVPDLGAYPSGSLKAITPDNVDQMTILGALNFPDRVCDIGYSPDGKYLAIRLETRMVLWDVSTGQEYAALEHKAWIENFAFTPDSKALIVSAGNVFNKTINGSTLHYWNVETSQEEYTWKPQVGFANSIAVNPKNPAIIAIVSFERQFVEERPNAIMTSNIGVELWDGTNFITRFTDFRQFYREGYNKLNDRVLAFGHDGKTLFVCLNNGEHHGGQILAWEGLGSGELRAISEPDECFMGLTLNRQGNALAISNAPEGKLTVRDLASGTIIYADEDKHQLPYRLEFDGTGSILIVGRSPKGREAGRVDLVNLQTGETIRKLTSSGFIRITFSPDNTVLAIQGDDVRLWGIPQ